jgi:hypothetical protein
MLLYIMLHNLVVKMTMIASGIGNHNALGLF